MFEMIEVPIFLFRYSSSRYSSSINTPVRTGSLLVTPYRIGVGSVFTSQIVVGTKYDSETNIFFRKYLTAFSSEVMFISGDTRGTYRFGNHGLFYIVDFFLIFIGLLNLFKNKKKRLAFSCV